MAVPGDQRAERAVSDVPRIDDAVSRSLKAIKSSGARRPQLLPSAASAAAPASAVGTVDALQPRESEARSRAPTRLTSPGEGVGGRAIECGRRNSLGTLRLTLPNCDQDSTFVRKPPKASRQKS